MRSEWLAQYLTCQAEPLNQAYRLARQGDPVRFADAFSGFIRELLDPMLVGLDHWPGESKAALTEAAYHSGLAMARHGWFAPEHKVVSAPLFQQILPAWLLPYPDDAPRLLIHLLNALSHLPSIPQRSQLLVNFQACLPSPDVVADTLVLLCWMSGLAQYREAALVAMNRCSDLLTTLGLGDPKQFENPWWQGAQKQWRNSPVELGASVWLGGEFTNRPQLATAAGQLLIQAGDDVWQLYADAFGQLLHPHHQAYPKIVAVPACAQVPFGLASHWREFDQPRQCLERPHDWVFSFHNRYAVLVIPKVGALQ